MRTVRIIKLIVALTTIFAIQAASAQNLVASSYVEQSFVSSKLGYSIGVKFQETKIELGVFQQNSMVSFDTENSSVTDYERTFTGVYMNYPMFETRTLTLNFKIRTGVSNGENFVITPAVNGDYTLNRKIQVMGGVGVRAFRPTLMTGIKIII